MRTHHLLPLALVPVLLLTVHCGSPRCDEGTLCAPDPASDAGDVDGSDGAATDASRIDGGASRDGGIGPDGGSSQDSGPSQDSGAAEDGGIDPGDAAIQDGGSLTDASADSGIDSGSADSGSPDSGSPDSGSAGAVDAGGVDAGGGGPGGCVSGAVGDFAARFHFAGNGPNSRAYVVYDVNNLPDSSRWKAGAYSRGAIGYQPNFTDTFLGIGGLEMGSTVFVDTELSTAKVASIKHVTISVFGRSFNTTSPGSFAWMSFDGSGATPSGLVSNSAPYKWYSADATSAFAPGNAGVLLRLLPGGPSGTLIVSRVEFCFQTK